jgi:hypothetical protein
MARLAEAERLIFLAATLIHPYNDELQRLRTELAKFGAVTPDSAKVCPHGYRLADLADGTDTCEPCATVTVTGEP